MLAPEVVEYLPLTQLEHTALPVTSLYFPWTHAVHGPLLGPVYPVLHLHAVDVVDPDAEFAFDVQI
jgi:hypothetical protein